MNSAYNGVWLTTLEEVQRHRSLAESSADWTALQVAILEMCIRDASQQIIEELGWLPLPQIETRSFDYSRDYISDNGYGMWVDTGLLSVTTLTNGDGTVIAGSSYTLKPNNRYPKQQIALNNNVTAVFRPATNGNTSQVINIAGEWGYVPHYGCHWRDSTIDLPTGGISAAAVSLTLGTGQGAVFETGDYLKIDSEYLLVETITGDVLTLERGVLGTTPAAHLAAVSIFIFQQLKDIRGAATEWAAYLYKARDRVGEQVQVFEGGLTVVNGLSPLVKMALRPHKRQQIGSL